MTRKELRDETTPKWRKTVVNCESQVKITGQGLWAIALSVALLWGCLIGERIAARRAFSERAKVLRDISRIERRQRTQPVSAPAPFIPHHARVAAG